MAEGVVAEEQVAAAEVTLLAAGQAEAAAEDDFENGMSSDDSRPSTGASGGGGGGGDFSGAAPSKCTARRGTSHDLVDTLRRIDNRPYGAYHDIEGTFAFDGGAAGGVPFALAVDKVQADPFAAPSRFHVTLPAAAAGFPQEARSSRVRAIALCDFLTRAFWRAAHAAGADQRRESGGWSGTKGGEITMDKPGQHVLERTSVQLLPDGGVQARFTVALPARGRTICGTWAAEILGATVPKLVAASVMEMREATAPKLGAASLCYSALDAAALREHIVSAEDQEALRSAVTAKGDVGFVANGAVLPRESGNSDRPMEGASVVRFQSPPELEVSYALPSGRAVTGMRIPPGVTLVVGGGFHGKSTLLQALEVGVYNHIPGDGREFVTVRSGAVKVRAEDGRSVCGVDISPFIDNLPFGRSTGAFTTADASGSTSQAASIMEALEAGCDTLMVDEDTCATNFMIRDARMQALVAPDKEPITPFISKASARAHGRARCGLLRPGQRARPVRALYADKGVSSVLVIGGAGDYFEGKLFLVSHAFPKSVGVTFYQVADTVVMMDCYAPRDVTAQARAIVTESLSLGHKSVIQLPEFGQVSQRTPSAASFTTHGKVVARGKDKIQYGDVDIELAPVEQLCEASQTRAIGAAMRLLASSVGPMAQRATMQHVLDWFDSQVDSNGLDALALNAFIGDFARPRRFELAAAINRYRGAERKSEMKHKQQQTEAGTAD
ncbi:hypothetical protein JKP88DRAFT_350965 [Tribonema minus]|uniref:Uncharacterized protein n=1 Tax=Tribonema minus TaxID=303371 RepID=A0A835YTL6_9STRA|nr:hypothetical protein JKP88DRAFT_350965 [Tribonema minus]